jgi:4'-phosphopantetheinyl transferase
MPHGPQLAWTTSRISPLGVQPEAAVRRSAGRELTRRLLAGMAYGGAAIEVDGRGKPMVADAPGLHVSIAHTGGLIAAAASVVGPVGIDVETRDRPRDFERLAGAAFGPMEIQLVAAQGAPAFYRLWTVREAIGKATGDGLTLVTDGIDRVPLAAPDGVWAMGQDGWLVAHDVVEQAVSLALAVRASDRAAIHLLHGMPIRQSQMAR